MRIGPDCLFAPDIPFCKLDVNGPKLPAQLKTRIEKLYLEPAEECNARGQWFAAGVLATVTVDFLASLSGSRSVRKRFEQYIRLNINEFADRIMAQRFYADFRDGLIHNGCVKRGGEFSCTSVGSAKLIDDRLCVNPSWLLMEVRTALKREVDQLDQNPKKREALSKRLAGIFKVELEAAGVNPGESPNGALSAGTPDVEKPLRAPLTRS